MFSEKLIQRFWYFTFNIVYNNFLFYFNEQNLHWIKGAEANCVEGVIAMKKKCFRLKGILDSIVLWNFQSMWTFLAALRNQLSSLIFPSKLILEFLGLQIITIFFRTAEPTFFLPLNFLSMVSVRLSRRKWRKANMTGTCYS